MKMKVLNCLLATTLHQCMLLTLKHASPTAADTDLYHSARSKQIYMPGDLILGGLFTLHVRSTSMQQVALDDGHRCHGTFSRRAYQAMQGMLMAVRTVNDNQDLLPGVQLGVDIKDTCGSVDFAVRESLNFSFVKKYFKNPSQCAEKVVAKDDRVKGEKT